jgi:hypothetical protein
MVYVSHTAYYSIVVIITLYLLELFLGNRAKAHRLTIISPSSLLTLQVFPLNDM